MGIYFNIRKRLEHFSLEADCGLDKGVLVIQGESGAGKTTLLNCIAGIDSPDEGEIRIQESLVFETNKVNLPAKSRSVGYLFQSYALFPHLSVKSNVVYGIKNSREYEDRQRRKELLHYGGELMDRFGISHLQDKSPMNISGGERQRVALARAMASRPKLLLLDEPFSALDAETRNLIYQEFDEFKARFDVPVILITHSQEEAERFGDHRLLMREGRIVS